jgi:CTP synthase
MWPELDKANSTEFDLSTPHPVIYLMEEWFDDKSGDGPAA